MDQKIIEWLLQGPAWLQYAVRLQLLHQKPEVNLALSDESIKAIVDQLKSAHGIPALRSGTVSYKNEPYWDLFFLADIGFTIADLHLEKEARMIYDLQSPDGTFLTMRDMKPSYFCIPTILLSSLVKMRFTDEAALRKYLGCILESQRLDGGWHCAKQRAIGQKLQHTESCPMDNLNVLLLLGQFPELRTDSRLKGAIDLLLNHWKRRDEKWRLYGFGTGTDYAKLKYPAVTYGILRVLDALSLFPYATKNPTFRSMMKYVHEKADHGQYYAESVVKFYDGFDFGQKAEPSRWITFLVNRIENRIELKPLAARAGKADGRA